MIYVTFMKFMPYDPYQGPIPGLEHCRKMSSRFQVTADLIASSSALQAEAKCGHCNIQEISLKLQLVLYNDRP